MFAKKKLKVFVSNLMLTILRSLSSIGPFARAVTDGCSNCCRIETVFKEKNGVWDPIPELNVEPHLMSNPEST
jgi:hypothetical protein